MCDSSSACIQAEGYVRDDVITVACHLLIAGYAPHALLVVLLRVKYRLWLKKVFPLECLWRTVTRRDHWSGRQREGSCGVWHAALLM